MCCQNWISGRPAAQSALCFSKVPPVRDLDAVVAGVVPALHLVGPGDDHEPGTIVGLLARVVANDPDRPASTGSSPFSELGPIVAGVPLGHVAGDGLQDLLVVVLAAEFLGRFIDHLSQGRAHSHELSDGLLLPPDDPSQPADLGPDEDAPVVLARLDEGVDLPALLPQRRGDRIDRFDLRLALRTGHDKPDEPASRLAVRPRLGRVILPLVRDPVQADRGQDAVQQANDTNRVRLGGRAGSDHHMRVIRQRLIAGDRVAHQGVDRARVVLRGRVEAVDDGLHEEVLEDDVHSVLAASDETEKPQHLNFGATGFE